MTDGPWQHPPAVRTAGELALFLAAAALVAAVAGAAYVVLRPVVVVQDAVRRLRGLAG